MKKITLFMLMAVGLLISTTMSAMPERPVPPEPKAPEGIEMPKEPQHPALQEKGLVKKTFNKIANQTPNKAPMGETVVAKIGDAEYTSLQAAFDAARLAAPTQTTIDVIDDITESDELWIYGNSDVILNLNGKTITLSGTNSIDISYSPEPGYTSTLNDKLTIVDNGQAKNGKIIGQGYPIYNSGTTTISDVTIESTDDGSTNYGYGANNYAMMTINSGHMKGLFGGAYNKGTMYINGGTIESTYDENSYYGYGIKNCGTLEMTGGIVKGSGTYAVGIRNAAEKGYPSKVTITGGSVDGSSYYGIYNDGQVEVSGNAKVVGLIGVYNEAKNAHVDVKGNAKINEESGSYNYGIYNDGESSSATISDNASIYGYYYGVYMSGKSSSVTITGGILSNYGYTKDGGYYAVVHNAGEYGSITMTGGTIGKLGTYFYGNGIKNNNVSSASINISGGKIDAYNIAVYNYAYCDNVTISGSAEIFGYTGISTYGKVYISGGTIKGTSTTLTISDNDYLPSITGGTFGHDPKQYLKNGYTSVYNESDNTYTVIKSKAAKIEGKGEFETLEEAIEAAADNDVITLLTRVDVDEELKIEKDITLDLANNSINYTTTSATLNLQGNITIKNGEIYALSSLHNSTAQNYGIKISSGSAKLNNVTITCEKVATAKYYSAYYGVYVASGASAEIINCNVVAYYYGIYTKGHTKVEGGDIYAYMYGIYVAGGVDASSAELSENLTCLGGYSAIDVGGYQETPATCIVYGGTYKAERNAPFNNYGIMTIYDGWFSSDANYKAYTTGTLTVWGGYFKTGIIDYSTMYTYGGTYNKRLEGCLSKTPSAGYDYDENTDGTVTIKKIIANIVGSEISYFSLQDAINAANDNDEIILKTDVTESITVSGKEITLNANTFTLTGDITAASGALIKIDFLEGKFDGNFVENGGKIKVYRGRFTKDPSNFTAKDEGSFAGEPKDGIYTVQQYIAQVNNDETKLYLVFADAVKEANNNDNATIKLFRNAELDKNVINVKKSMTIDLGGYSLMSVNTPNSDNDSYLRFGQTGTQVTIKNGTITNAPAATHFVSDLLSIQAKNQVTLDNVTISHKGDAAVAVMKQDAKLIVNSNCSLSGKKYAVLVAAGTLENNATDIIVGVGGVGSQSANIINNAGATMSLTTRDVSEQDIVIKNAGSLEITSGVYAKSITVEEGTITISGGVFYDAVKNQVASYKVSDKDWKEIKYYGNKAWDLHAAEETVVAIADGINYYSLEDAIVSVAKNGVETTIQLQTGINVDIKKNAQYPILEGQNILLDLNGQTINATNTSKGGTAVVFDIAHGATLTIDDTSEGKDGLITYNKTCTEGGVEYTINCNGTLTLKNGTIENTTKKGTVPYAIEIGKGGIVNIKGGLVVSQYNFAIRYWADVATNTVLNVSGGEIKGTRAVWIQLADSKASEHPYATFNMTGGTLTSTDETENIAFYVYTFGQSLDNIVINVTKGIINGRFLIGGGEENGGDYNEDIEIKGGNFRTTKPINPYKVYQSFKRGVEHRSISGGAFYFDESWTNNDYIQFCEYITNGHYAVKMCRDDVNGTYSNPNIEGKYNLCEGEDCGDGTFWAVIDGEGTKEEQKPTGGWWGDGSDGKPGAFEPGNVPDSHTDVVIKGSEEEGQTNIVEIGTDVVAEANRVVIEKGAGIIVHYGATLDVGAGGIEIDGNGTGTTYIIVEPGGTLTANGTVVSQNVDEIQVKANASGSGIVLLEPNLDYNNQPKSTIEMYTYARYIPEQEKYIWQHFGIPTKEAPTTITNDRGCGTQYWQWNYDKADWEQINYTTRKEVKTPFRGYNLVTNYEKADGVTYTFTGQILGNGDATFDLVKGFNFYANSYLAPINATTLIRDIDDENIEWTVWMYNGKEDNFEIMNQSALMFGKNCEIPAMRGFFLKLTSGNGGETGINYENAVWGNAISKKMPKAPAKMIADDMSLIQISLKDNNGKGDVVYLVQSDDFDAMFNNGYDASKQMSTESANLYAETMAGQLSAVATDDLDGLYLSMNTKSENVYTMTFTHQNGELFELVDLYDGQTVLMTEGATYTFVARENAEFNNRFQVRKVHMAPTNNEIVELEGKAKNGIYTPLGQYVGNVNAWSILPSGVYVVNGQRIVK